MTWSLWRNKNSRDEEHNHQKESYRSSMSLLMDIPGFKQDSSFSRETPITSNLDEMNSTFSLSYPDKKVPSWPPKDPYEYFMMSKTSPHSTGNLALMVWEQIVLQSDEVRVQAIDLLNTRKKSADTRVFTKALYDVYWEVRAAAAQALGNIGEQILVPDLLEALQSESDFTVRQALVRALGKCGEWESLNLLVQLLRDPNQNWQVREAAAWSLGQFGQTVPTWPLIDALCGDPDETVRAAAARALGEIENTDAAPMLTEVMKGDEDEDVQEAARWALQQLEQKEKKFLRILRPILRNWLRFPPLRQKEEPFDERGDYGQKIHERVLFVLMHFIRNKTGFVSHTELVHGDQQPTLFLSYCYQQTEQTLQEEVIPQLKTLIPVESLESVVANHHELLQEVQMQVEELQAHRRWHETILVILELYAPEVGPMRAVFCGIGCHAVRSSDPPILNQILNQWRASCQGQQEVSHIQIGYQSCGALSS